MEYINIESEAIASVKQDILNNLNITQLEDSSNLIEQGLSSIMIMKFANKLRKFGIKVSFIDLMEHPTLGEWKNLIHSAKVRKSSKEKVKTKREEKENGISQKEFDLTDVQYAYWVGRNDDQPLGGVGCHAYLEIDGENVDPVQLNDAWNILQKYHPMLRAKFTEDGKQMIMDEPYLKQIKIYDLQNISEEEVAQRFLELRAELSHRKLNIEKGEVAGVSLAMLPQQKTKIFFDVDLLVADVLSLSILIRDLAEAYNGKNLDSASEFTFQDYIEGREKEINDEELERDKEYWIDKIKHFPKEAPNLPLKRKPELISKTVFHRRRKIIEKSTWDAVKETAAKYQMTPSMFLLSCYVLVLERWCNQDSFLINMPLFNRDTEDENLQNMVADFTNLLLIDFTRKEKETFLDTMRRTQKLFLENVAHSSYSGVQVQRDIYKEIGNSSFVAPVVFACNLDYALETPLSRKLFGKISYMVSQTPQVWLDFQTYIKDGSLVLCWDAVEELYPEGLLDNMFQSLVDMIYMLSKKEDWNIILDVFPEHEQKEREAELNKILPLQYPNRSLFSNFLKNVGKNPNNIALIDAVMGKEVSYKELYDTSMQIASLLVNSGVNKGDYVGITLPRGYRQVYAIFGILFVGGVYVPIGVNQPKERREKIYEQIEIKAVVSDTDTIENLSLDEENILLVNVDENTSIERTLEQPIEISQKDSAYVIMTSGSTGIPKGVEICHENAVNTIEDINAKYHISKDDAVLMVSAIDFDISVYDIFGLFSVGGKVVMLDEENYKDPDLWLKLIDQYNISIWNSVPILFDMLVTMAEGKNRQIPLRVVMLSGDWIGIDLPSRFYNRSQDSVVVAMGGATEASIWSNYLNVPKEIPDTWTSIPYGKALENQVYRVVDEFGRTCPNYVQGELWIGGVGVAKCYRGDEELTKKKYITDVIKWYRTGDSGRTWKDGTIEFLGRKDNQVKIKGHRIELGEIEDAISKLQSFSNIKVISNVRKNSIYAFIEKKGDRKNELEIKEKLKCKLPQYMIPERIIYLNQLPLNKNNKIDEKALLIKVGGSLNDQNKKQERVHSKLEEKILNIFKRYLNNNEYEVDSNFFKNGGNSLTALNIMLKINAEIDCQLSISDIFTNPTIRELIEKIVFSKEISARKIHLLEKKEPINNIGVNALTSIQYSYWISRKGYGKVNKQPSNCYIEIECNNLNLLELEKGINILINKYKMFQTLVDEDGLRFKFLENIPYYSIEEFDLSFFNEDTVNKKLLMFREEIITYINNPSDWNPIDVKVSKLSKDKSIIHLCFDNLYFDALSIVFLLNELNFFYVGDYKELQFNRGKFVNHSMDKVREDERYWREKAEQLYPAPLIVNNNENLSVRKFDRLRFSISEEDVKTLNDISQKFKVTTSNIILSVFSEIITLWSNSERYSINITLLENKKSIHDFIGEVGDYTTNILNSIHYDRNQNFYERTRKIQENMFRDMQHMSYDGVSVLRDLRKKDGGLYSEMPIVYTNTIGNAISINTDNIGEIKYIVTQTPGVYLDCQVSIINKKFTISWDYVEGMFDHDVIFKYFQIFENTFKSIIYDDHLWNEYYILDIVVNYCNGFEEGRI